MSRDSDNSAPEIVDTFAAAVVDDYDDAVVVVDTAAAAFVVKALD